MFNSSNVYEWDDGKFNGKHFLSEIVDGSKKTLTECGYLPQTIFVIYGDRKRPKIEEMKMTFENDDEKEQQRHFLIQHLEDMSAWAYCFSWEAWLGHNEEIRPSEDPDRKEGITVLYISDKERYSRVIRFERENGSIVFKQELKDQGKAIKSGRFTELLNERIYKVKDLDGDVIGGLVLNKKDMEKYPISQDNINNLLEFYESQISDEPISVEKEYIEGFRKAVFYMMCMSFVRIFGYKEEDHEVPEDYKDYDEMVNKMSDSCLNDPELGTLFKKLNPLEWFIWLLTIRTKHFNEDCLDFYGDAAVVSTAICNN